MEIKVLGAGCPRCEKLEQDLMALMAELNIAAGLEHVRDPIEIANYGAIGSPALIIDGSVKAVGSETQRMAIGGGKTLNNINSKN
ncbi:MAG: thioredoxin family protein [Deltaproteobacteria bacterium]|nr:thioredoxin family protein [Deltaproteobacteria bacterium]